MARKCKFDYGKPKCYQIGVGDTKEAEKQAKPTTKGQWRARVLSQKLDDYTGPLVVGAEFDAKILHQSTLFKTQIFKIPSLGELGSYVGEKKSEHLGGGDWELFQVGIEAIIDKQKGEETDMATSPALLSLEDNLNGGATISAIPGKKVKLLNNCIENLYFNYGATKSESKEIDMSDTKRFSKTRKLGKLYRLAAVVYLTQALVPKAAVLGKAATPAVMWIVKHGVRHLTPWDAMEWSGTECWAVVGGSAVALVAVGVVGKVVARKTGKSLWSIA